MKLAFTQKITENLDPLGSIDNPTEPFNPAETITEIFLSPLRVPDQQILDDAGEPQDESVALDQLMTSFDTDGLDKAHQDDTRAMLATALTHYTDHDHLLTDQFFVEQQRVTDDLPEASDDIIYSITTDVTPVCEAILDRQSPIQSLLYPMFTTVRPRSTVYAFKDNNTFQAFLKKIPDYLEMLGTPLPGKTKKFIDEFRKTVVLDEPAEGLFLRKTNMSMNERLSTARTIIWLLNMWSKEQDEYTTNVLPFSVNELTVPRVVTFMNIEKTAQTSKSVIQKKWNTIRNMYQNANKFIDQKTLRTFTSVENMVEEATKKSKVDRENRNILAAKRAHKPLANTEPSPEMVFQAVEAMAKKMSHTSRSQNYIKVKRPSFMRSNRRQPDNPSMPGKVTKKQYYPDIVLHIDTSPSVQPKHYEQTVRYIIASAKRHDVNVYIASFADYYVMPVLLPIEGRSVRQVTAHFHHIQKAFGNGTDVEPIWDFLNANPRYQKALNLIITDFGFHVPAEAVIHPKNTFYAPLNGMDWDSIKWLANGFIEGMKHIDPKIRTKILGM